MEIQDHFSDRAADYARYRPRYPDSLFGFLASQCRARALVWDVGAGSGQASLGLAEHFDHVMATDVSREQLVRAPRRANIHYVVAPAEAAPLPVGCLDLVVVAQALHWFEREAFWHAADKALRAEGILAVWCYGLMRIDKDLDEVIHHLYSETLGSYWPDRRRLVEEGYQSIDLPFAERICPPFEMKERWDLTHLLGYLGTWSAVRAYAMNNGNDPVALAREELSSAWGPPSVRREIRWPLHLRVCGRNVP